MHQEIQIDYNLSTDTDVWFVRAAPAKTWEFTLHALKDLRDQPPLEVRYGISHDAARLLEWIEGLRDKDYLGKWTPLVEDEPEKKIGLTCPWDKANLSAYLAELINELNDRTPYEFALQPWRCYSEWKTRIQVSKKKSDESLLIQQIQFLALKAWKTCKGRSNSRIYLKASRVDGARTIDAPLRKTARLINSLVEFLDGI